MSRMKTKLFLLISLAFLLFTAVSCSEERGPDTTSGTPPELPAVTTESYEEETTRASETESTTVLPETDAPSQTEPSVSETETESETESEPVYIDRTDAVRIWVGDSRVVGLSECGAGDPEKDVFIGKNGRYYVWFYNDALPVLRGYLDTGDPYEDIIQIGINDCANLQMKLLPYYAEDYAELINSLIDEYPAARFWFLSVGEVIGTYGANTRWEVKMEDLNPLVEPFNEIMREECRAYYLPVGELIKADGKSYIDNVHYSVETNLWIYDYVLTYIQGADE